MFPEQNVRHTWFAEKGTAREEHNLVPLISGKFLP